MNNFCANCGTALREEMLFCPACGTKKGEQEKEELAEMADVQIKTGNKDADIVGNFKNACTKITKLDGKKKKALLIGGILIVVTLVLAIVSGNKGKAPFFGIERGDSVKTVEQKMGDPDDFDNNGSRNYNYYYDNIKFLKMEGYVDIHFELDKVDTLSFECSYASMSDYEEAVKYYTKQYGEPIAKNSNYSDYYSVSECAYWSMDDGSRMELEYHSAAAYEPPSLSVYVYN